MNDALIAGRYTRALFAIATKNNLLLEIKNDMEYLYALYRESKPFQIFLENPVLKPTQKFNIFKEVFSYLNNTTLSLIELIIKNRREEILPFIALDYVEKYYKEKNIEKAIIKVAAPINSENLEKIKQKLVNALQKEIVLSTEEDKTILGGFILKISDKQIDASVKTRLNKIQQKLMQAQITKR